MGTCLIWSTLKLEVSSVKLDSIDKATQLHKHVAIFDQKDEV